MCMCVAVMYVLLMSLCKVYEQAHVCGSTGLLDVYLLYVCFNFVLHSKAVYILERHFTISRSTF